MARATGRRAPRLASAPVPRPRRGPDSAPGLDWMMRFCRRSGRNSCTTWKRLCLGGRTAVDTDWEPYLGAARTLFRRPCSWAPAEGVRILACGAGGRRRRELQTVRQRLRRRRRHGGAFDVLCHCRPHPDPARQTVTVWHHSWRVSCPNEAVRAAAARAHHWLGHVNMRLRMHLQCHESIRIRRVQASTPLSLME